MLPTIITNKRGRFDGLDTKDKKQVADALLWQTEKVAVWVFDDDSLATMVKMHQTQSSEEVDVVLQVQPRRVPVLKVRVGHLRDMVAVKHVLREDLV